MKNNQNIHIAIDMMSGDFGLEVTVPAVINFLKKYKHVHLLLVGEETKIKGALDSVNNHSRLKNLPENISVVNCTQVVEMDESPLLALRRKPDSSMRVALNLVAANKANACVSGGNTGALMVMAKYVLKTIPGIDRPAILYPLPSKDRSVSVLDLGANIECNSKQLLQFAVMGSVLVSALENKKHPSIGLLNIGTEEIKGTEIIKDASKLISECEDLNYFGFVEGDDIYKGTVDLVVCDGFVGNVTLKVSEGLAKLIIYYFKKIFNRNFYTKLLAILIRPILKKLFNQINPNKYNGASFLGLNGIVIKSHGGADSEAFGYAIKAAELEARKNVPWLIKEKVAWYLRNYPKI